MEGLSVEGYLKWAKILKIAFYVAIPIDIAILIYTIYTKNFFQSACIVHCDCFHCLDENTKQANGRDL